MRSALHAACSRDSAPMIRLESRLVSPLPALSVESWKRSEDWRRTEVTVEWKIYTASRTCATPDLRTDGRIGRTLAVSEARYTA